MQMHNPDYVHPDYDFYTHSALVLSTWLNKGGEVIMVGGYDISDVWPLLRTLKRNADTRPMASIAYCGEGVTARSLGKWDGLLDEDDKHSVNWQQRTPLATSDLKFLTTALRDHDSGLNIVVVVAQKPIDIIQAKEACAEIVEDLVFFVPRTAPNLHELVNTVAALYRGPKIRWCTSAQPSYLLKHLKISRNGLPDVPNAEAALINWGNAAARLSALARGFARGPQNNQTKCAFFIEGGKTESVWPILMETDNRCETHSPDWFTTAAICYSTLSPACLGAPGAVRDLSCAMWRHRSPLLASSAAFLELALIKCERAIQAVFIVPQQPHDLVEALNAIKGAKSKTARSQFWPIVFSHSPIDGDRGTNYEILKAFIEGEVYTAYL